MAIRNNALGGTDWAGEGLVYTDLNDTINSINGNFEIFEPTNLSVSTTSSSVSFTNTTNAIEIQNTGSKTAYINFDAVATTSHFSLESGRRVYVVGRADALHAICDTGDSTNLYIIAYGNAQEPTNLSIASVTATSTSSSTAIGDNPVVIKNTGSKTVYLNFDATATISHLKLLPLEVATIKLRGASNIHYVTNGSGSHTDSGSGSWGTIFTHTITEDDVASGRFFLLSAYVNLTWSNYGTMSGNYGIEHEQRLLHQASDSTTKRVHTFYSLITPSTSPGISAYEGNYVVGAYIASEFVVGDKLLYQVWMDAFWGSGGSGTCTVNRYALLRQDKLSGEVTNIGGELSKL